MKKIISIILCAAICFGLLSAAGTACFNKETKMLQFNSEANFKIMQISDIQDTPYMAPIISDYLKALCEKEQPDLVVLTGDNIGKSCGKAATQEIAELQVMQGINNYMSVFQKFSIPVAAVFGNHDAEGRVSKEAQMKYYSRYSCFVGYDADPDLYGCGTYNLPILSSDGMKTAYNLWMIDSNMYDDENGGYDYVHQDEVDWYINKSNELKAANNGVAVPSMVFQHIIVPEIYDAVENATLISGSMNETPGSSTLKSAEFTSMVRQGDVKAMFFGHDHVNTFSINYQGIDLVATPAAGFNLSSDLRGVRIINLNENDTSTYETYLINYKDTFCTDTLSTIRYMMNAAEYGDKSQTKYAFEYLLLAPLKGRNIFKVIYELICTVM